MSSCVVCEAAAREKVPYLVRVGPPSVEREEEQESERLARE